MNQKRRSPKNALTCTWFLHSINWITIWSCTSIGPIVVDLQWISMNGFSLWCFRVPTEKWENTKLSEGGNNQNFYNFFTGPLFFLCCFSFFRYISSTQSEKWIENLIPLFVVSKQTIHTHTWRDRDKVVFFLPDLELKSMSDNRSEREYVSKGIKINDCFLNAKSPAEFNCVVFNIGHETRT